MTVALRLNSNSLWLAAALAWSTAAPARAQSPAAAPSATPSSLLSRNLRPAEEAGPRDTPLVEKPWDQLSDKDISRDGAAALAIEPARWKHAETENFILHFRRVTEAQKVAREVEYDLWFIAKTLGATKERYARKSHVYVFEDEKEWQLFLSKTEAPKWSASFAHGDELFLSVRGTAEAGRFNSNTLAHETTHAVVARLYPQRRWPLWLNEGFAEFMGGASIAARKGQTLKRYQARLGQADLPLETLAKMEKYPEDPVQVGILYQSAEKFVRFLMTEAPREHFPQFIDAMLDGATMQAAVVKVYGDKFKDWEAFQKAYSKYSR